ncbi:MAG: hypothetical protein Q8L88_12225 [Bacteroidota bacterium]|nr:hypothetical protein [Bacteroidota bacterium]
MKNRTNIFVSVVLLIVYGTLTLVTVPLHFHEDPLFVSGNGEHRVVQHDDAFHCHHHVVEIHTDCTICSFISHSSCSKVVAVVPQFNPKSVEYISTFCIAIIDQHASSHSRRGPPVTLA